ncbi:hypothetical protein HYPSUDRAFT_58594 [Hypholoma sublateritium FD-334 SS-4]|uniref:Uncharacterized protein n=1 Tax=Hypholoma sublateritium (strain FD-334 SS-4) TaxID=945553 RepID=A0A0D2P5W0_HYPSF|nr:hypothetical protein HYPSUDRAFT_58594 [Hypholoma sublateritium FD-334 SS-4]
MGKMKSTRMARHRLLPRDAGKRNTVSLPVAPADIQQVLDVHRGTSTPLSSGDLSSHGRTFLASHSSDNVLATPPLMIIKPTLLRTDTQGESYVWAQSTETWDAEGTPMTVGDVSIRISQQPLMLNADESMRGSPEPLIVSDDESARGSPEPLIGSPEALIIGDSESAPGSLPPLIPPDDKSTRTSPALLVGPAPCSPAPIIISVDVSGRGSPEPLLISDAESTRGSPPPLIPSDESARDLLAPLVIGDDASKVGSPTTLKISYDESFRGSPPPLVVSDDESARGSQDDENMKQPQDEVDCIPGGKHLIHLILYYKQSANSMQSPDIPPLQHTLAYDTAKSAIYKLADTSDPVVPLNFRYTEGMLHDAHLQIQGTSMGNSTYQDKARALGTLRSNQLDREMVSVAILGETKRDLNKIHSLLKRWL